MYILMRTGLYAFIVGWLFSLGLNGPLRQYFSISGHLPERGRKEKRKYAFIEDGQKVCCKTKIDQGPVVQN